MDVKIFPLGDTGIVAQLGETIDPEIHLKVRALASRLDEKPLPGMVEYTPAFTTVTVFYDPVQLRYDEAYALMEEAVSEMEPVSLNDSRVVEIPVCYGGEFGPDLPFMADHNGLTPQEVIDLHSGVDYLVYMIGLAPGFPYLGGMSERIAAPRRAAPRTAIPVGSVGIAGMQTGIYSVETPGGWQLIGRTPLALFRPEESPPSLLAAGDRVIFQPITREQYESWPESLL